MLLLAPFGRSAAIRWDEFSNSSLFTRMQCIQPECNAPLFTTMHCATNNFYFKIKTRGSSVGKSVHRSLLTQSFLCGKLSTARLEVLTNLRHAGVFQMNTMVNLGIGFQEPLTRSSVKRDEKMSICSSTRGICKFQIVRRWSESEKISCHAILKNLYEPKMDVILTISFKITAEIENDLFCVLLCRWGHVSAFCKAQSCSFICCPGMRLHC